MADLEQLTHHQRQIALLVGEGLSRRAISERLHISEGTVDTLVRRIAQRHCPKERHLSDTQRVFIWVRRIQWEKQREAGAA